ncbi:unnamed protein product [Pylaiella littoralis]
MIRHCTRRVTRPWPVPSAFGVSSKRRLHEGRTVLDVSLGESDHVIQVFGANTDVGKTVITAGLLRAAAMQGLRPSYIKPVQAGSPTDASFVARHAVTSGVSSSLLCRTSTLFDYTDPVSPHLAAERDGGYIASDTDIVEAIVREVSAVISSDRSSSSSSSSGGGGGGGGISGNDKAGDGGCSTSSSSSAGNLVLVEAAGGVLSPAPSGSLQADAFRPIRLPVLLVGDGKLGGIGVTLSALESLRTRGYSVLGIALFAQDNYLGNADALSSHASSIPVFELPALPPPELPLEPWYDADATARGFQGLLDGLAERRVAGVVRLAGMKARGHRALWWPFTQHDDLSKGKVNLLDSAYGDYFCVADVEEGQEGKGGEEGGAKSSQIRVSYRALVDACASWWTQGAGHGNPGMALAIAEAAGRYGHVIFPGNIHAPALEVAERLLEGPGRGWASRVFFTDNGSTATEVAIKMGFRRFLKDRFALSEPPSGTRLSVVAQEGCYHGDTLGAMNVAVPSVFNRGQHAWYQAQGLFFEVPNVSWRDGCFSVALPKAMHAAALAKAAEVELTNELMLESRDAAFEFGTRDAGALASFYRSHVRQVDASKMDAFEAEKGAILGSLLLEPIVMGAGGMVFVDPLFQRILVQECRARGMPVIYDEVFSGLWRLGVESTRELLGEDPDVSCYAKLLTGGLVPMAATVATERVFDAFSGAKADCLLHGHSYTAHPVGCAAAVEFLSQLEKSAAYPGAGGRMANSWDESAVRELSRLPTVDRAFGLGSVLAVEMKTAERGYASQGAVEVVQRLHESGVYARVLGNVAYVMISPTTPGEACADLMATVTTVIRDFGEDGGRKASSDPDSVAYSI